MENSVGAEAAEADPGAVGALTDLAADLGRSCAQVLLARAVALHAAYCEALTFPESFARGNNQTRSESGDLVESSIRTDFAVALKVSERAVSRALEQAQLLIEELPCTCTALATGHILWEASEVICAAARTLPAASRATLDERAGRCVTTRPPVLPGRPPGSPPRPRFADEPPPF